MGDRGNIYFVDQCDEDGSTSGIYMYSHWTGSDLPWVLQEALKRGRSRWNDIQYLPRIIFCEMVKGDVESETGFGLSTRIGDNGNPIVRVDCYRQLVDFVAEGDEQDLPPVGDDYGFSFEEYVELDDAQLRGAFRGGS
jgi:hypothetical protein